MMLYTIAYGLALSLIIFPIWMKQQTSPDGNTSFQPLASREKITKVSKETLGVLWNRGAIVSAKCDMNASDFELTPNFDRLPTIMRKKA